MPSDVTTEIAGPEGLSLVEDRKVLTAGDIAALTEGQWETNARHVIRARLQAGERVLECGAGLGVVSMTIAQVVGAANLASVEANPAAVALARRNFARNRLDVSLHHAVLRNRQRLAIQPGPAAFNLAPNPFASSVLPLRKGVEIKVPVLELEALIDQHRATVLVLDIEGGEVELLCGADLSAIRKIVTKTSYRKASRAATNYMVRELYAQGFCLDLTATRGEVIYLHRGLDPADESLG